MKIVIQIGKWFLDFDNDPCIREGGGGGGGETYVCEKRREGDYFLEYYFNYFKGDCVVKIVQNQLIKPFFICIIWQYIKTTLTLLDTEINHEVIVWTKDSSAAVFDKSDGFVVIATKYYL